MTDEQHSTNSEQSVNESNKCSRNVNKNPWKMTKSLEDKTVHEGDR